MNPRPLAPAWIIILATSLVVLPVGAACADCTTVWCGNSGAVLAQDISVSGADQGHFSDGRGACYTYQGSAGYDRVTYDFRVFELQLYVPADRVRYMIGFRIDGYRGPGVVHGYLSSGNLQPGDPQNPSQGPIVTFEVYHWPSVAHYFASPPPAPYRRSTVEINSDGKSGSIDFQYSDLAFAGTWRCTVTRLPMLPTMSPLPG